VSGWRRFSPRYQLGTSTAPTALRMQTAHRRALQTSMAVWFSQTSVARKIHRQEQCTGVTSSHLGRLAGSPQSPTRRLSSGQRRSQPSPTLVLDPRGQSTARSGVLRAAGG
jgi:hypothetical protein